MAESLEFASRPGLAKGFAEGNCKDLMIDLVLDDNAGQTLCQLNCGDDFAAKRVERDALHDNVDEEVKLCLCSVECTFGFEGYDGICFQHGQGYYNFIEWCEVYI